LAEVTAPLTVQGLLLIKAMRICWQNDC